MPAKRFDPNTMKAFPMKSRLGRSLRPGIWQAALAVAAVTSFSLHAQPTPPAGAATTAAAKPKEDLIELTPFEVRTDKDTSYGALNSNSVTRFNTELDKVPISADIFTEEFMN